MSRIKTLLVGIFVVGAGRAMGTVDEAIRGFIGAQYEPPLDLTLLVDTASVGLMGLGGLMIGYAVLATVFHFIMGALKGRGGSRRQPQQQQAPPQQQGGQAGQQRGGKRRQQQQPRQGQQGQQQQRQGQQGQQRRRRQE